MTDLELLELAAKAAGYKGEWTPEWFAMCDGDNQWRPLMHNGQALRLAVKLGINPEFEGFDIEICRFHSGAREFCYVEPHGKDPYSATRRVIVRAAAEIGKSME